MTIPREWIEQLTSRLGPPTDFQWLAWARLTHGGNFLLRSATGSGKTLAAFIPCLAALRATATRSERAVGISGVQLLYVSPLRALIADMGTKIRSWTDILWKASGDVTPPASFELTGDTCASKRRLFRQHPSSILLTTPESLARLLAHPDRMKWFAPLEAVIIDEWHAMAATKRGADLGAHLERLQSFCPKPLARIGLSATIANPELISQCLVGPGRQIEILSSRQSKEIQIQIRSIPKGIKKIPFTAQMLSRDHAVSNSNGFTLCFVNTRSTAEKLGYQLSQLRPDLVIRIHHGSLSRLTRETTEHELRKGQADILIASSSLELGVDLGGIRQVFLLDPPGEVVRLLQRIGRSGRGPEQIPRGIILTEGESSLFEAAVTAGLGEAGWMESLAPPREPKDLLCQHLLGEALAQPFEPLVLWETLKKSWYFQNLSWTSFQNAIAFLSGWPDFEGKLRLPPRLGKTGEKIWVPSTRIGAIIRQSLGTIVTNPMIPVLTNSDTADKPIQISPFRGPNQKIIGQVDEWYADSLKPGDRFLLNGRSWERTGGTHREILVTETKDRPLSLRWAGIRSTFSPALAQKLFTLRALAKTHLRESTDSLCQWFCTEFPMAKPDALALVDCFENQDRLSQIPEPGMVLVESVPWDSGIHWDLHLPLPGSLCHHLGQLIKTRAFQKGWGNIDCEGTDLGLRIWDANAQLVGPQSHSLERLKTLLDPADWETDWQTAIQDSDLLRRNFQNSAEICLMILPPGVNHQRSTRVGGRSWAARRLFDRMATLEDRAIPIIQAFEDLIKPEEKQVLNLWFERLQQSQWILRHLSFPSPFALGWKISQNPAPENQDFQDRIREVQRALGDV